jgi:hypothetical protein
MSQPTQIFSAGPSNSYNIIDNAAPTATITINAGSSVWSPLLADGSGHPLGLKANGAQTQGSNAVANTNGTIPDAVNRSSSKINNPSLAPGVLVKFLNPA